VNRYLGFWAGRGKLPFVHLGKARSDDENGGNVEPHQQRAQRQFEIILYTWGSLYA
jgi:hypothetical protein